MCINVATIASVRNMTCYNWSKVGLNLWKKRSLYNVGALTLYKSVVPDMHERFHVYVMTTSYV